MAGDESDFPRSAMDPERRRVLTLLGVGLSGLAAASLTRRRAQGHAGILAAFIVF